MSADEPIPSVSPEQPGDSTQAGIIAPGYTDEAIADVARLAEVYERTVTHNPFIRKDMLKDGVPHPKQQEFLMLSDVKEVFYGGAAAGGKSYALLMAALQFVHVPGYNALILRDSFPNLNQPGALIPVSKTWLLNHQTEWGEAVWKERDKQWTFPSGATLTFGYLERYEDALKYRSSEFHYIAFDELSLLDEDCYLYLFSRLRKTKDLDVPLRMRSASNPGGRGHCVEYGMILTPHGWKDVKDFKVGDEVFTVNPSGELIATTVSQVHREDYEGEMIRATARGFRMHCTPEHRVAKIGGIKRRRNSKFSLVRFCDLPGQATILRSASWSGTPIDRFHVPKTPYKRRLKQPESLTGQQYAALMGWFLSEGCTADRDKTFSIAQCKQQHRDTIRGLLHECGFSFGESKTGFLIHSPDWWNYLRQFGKCREKFIPDELKNASAEELRTLFIALMDGDGNWTTREQSGTYFTLSRQLAEDFAEIAFKLGYIVSMRSRQRTSRKGACYEIRFKRTKSGGTELLTGHHVYKVGSTTKRRSDIKREAFKGKVYCIGVPEHHSFVIMQDGCVWVSGNSWVRERFILPHTRNKDAEFIPAKITDNPSMDREDYEKNLSHLDPVTRAQLMNGDWDVSTEGRFKIKWFEKARYRFDGRAFHLLAGNMEIGNGIRVQQCAIFVTVDLAASVKTSSDYTVFLAVAITPWQQMLILDVERKKHPVEQIPDNLKDFCDRIARDWGKAPSWAGVEANGMQEGIASACRRQPDMVPVKYLKPANQDKLARAQKAIIMAEQGQIYLPLNPAAWLDDFLYELTQFTGNPKLDAHDDIPDALSYAALNIGNAFYEAPSMSGRQGNAGERHQGPRASDDGMSRVWRREGRMRRLFGGG